MLAIPSTIVLDYACMPNHSNVALKTALFATGKKQQDIARLARIAPQALSHAIAGRRDLDAEERKRLIKALSRFGVERSIADLFSRQAVV